MWQCSYLLVSSIEREMGPQINLPESTKEDEGSNIISSYLSDRLIWIYSLHLF